jgi:hypothetical protein
MLMHRKLLAGFLLVGGLTFLAESAPADEQPAEKSAVSDAELVTYVAKRIQEWAPTPEERRFDEIGWSHSVLEVERLAQQHKRPIFWFTHDGKMSCGRC